jgi:hypothetical protein
VNHIFLSIIVLSKFHAILSLCHYMQSSVETRWPHFYDLSSSLLSRDKMFPHFQGVAFLCKITIPHQQLRCYYYHTHTTTSCYYAKNYHNIISIYMNIFIQGYLPFGLNCFPPSDDRVCLGSAAVYSAQKLSPRFHRIHFCK